MGLVEGFLDQSAPSWHLAATDLMASQQTLSKGVWAVPGSGLGLTQLLRGPFADASPGPEADGEDLEAGECHRGGEQ